MIEELQRALADLLRRSPRGLVAFDADGTLWSDDVGCLTFDRAVEDGFLREEARQALASAARAEGLDVDSKADANEIGRLISQAHAAGRFDEQHAAELQVWAYAGHRLQDVRDFSQMVLETRKRQATTQKDVVRLATFARSLGARLLVVSASPRWIVEQAVTALGFAPHEVIGGEAEEVEGRLFPRLCAPLPYGQEKVRSARRLAPDTPWLAAFGDSAFDVPMLVEAQLGVALGTKDSLDRALALLPQIVRWHAPQMPEPL